VPGGYGPEPPKKSKTLLIVAIACGVVLVGAAVALVLVLTRGDDKSTDKPSSSARASTSAAAEGEAGGSEDVEEYCKILGEIFEGEYVEIDDEGNVDQTELMVAYERLVEAAPADAKDAIRAVIALGDGADQSDLDFEMPEMPEWPEDPSDEKAMEEYEKAIDEYLENLEDMDIPEIELPPEWTKMVDDAARYCPSLPTLPTAVPSY
jgi:hypothetical protein